MRLTWTRTGSRVGVAVNAPSLMPVRASDSLRRCPHEATRSAASLLSVRPS